MMTRNKHLLKIANCAQKRREVRNGKIIMRIYSLKGNHEAPKEKETKIIVLLQLKTLTVSDIFLLYRWKIKIFKNNSHHLYTFICKINLKYDLLM